jgi:hypothetical protein
MRTEEAALELELDVTGYGDGYRIEARSTVGGESAADTQFRFDDLAMERRIERLRLALIRSAATTRRIATRDEQPVQRLGADLFDRLFVGDVRVLFDMTRQHAAHRDLPLRLVLRIRPPELAVLPWEFLYDQRRDDYLSLSMPMVRYPEILEPVRPLRVTRPLRILGMVARPTGYDALDIEGEKAHLNRALDPLVRDGQVELGWVEGETWRSLLNALHRGSWHIVHFIGHGGFDSGAGEGVFFLRGEGAENYMLRASRLAHLLSPHQSLRLVMLNSCDSAAGSPSDLFSSAAATLVRRGIPAVLAMQFEISDSAAVEFTRSFYEAVAAGLPVDIAVRDARLAVSLARPNSLEWGTPVIFLRQRDGRIFDLAAPTLRRPPPRPNLPPQFGRIDPRGRPEVRAIGDRSTQLPPTCRELGRETGGQRARRPPSGADQKRAEPAQQVGGRTRCAPINAQRRRTLALGTAGVVALVVGGVLAMVMTATGADSSATVAVPANADWTSTGMTVHKGQWLDISADGEVSVEPGVPTGPDGDSGRRQGAHPVMQGVGLGALLGRIGNGPPFAVRHDLAAAATADGELSLCVNDMDRADNTGQYIVHLQAA